MPGKPTSADEPKKRRGNETPRRYKGGRPVKTPRAADIDSRLVLRSLAAHLDAKPAEKIPVLLARQIQTLIEAQRDALSRLIGAARHALPDVINEDAAVSLDGRIEEAAELLREYQVDERPIIL